LDLWRWLLIPAIVALWIEWWLYYESRRKAELADSNPTFPAPVNSSFSGAARTSENTRDAELARQVDA
jgi:hypothetical protein